MSSPYLIVAVLVLTESYFEAVAPVLIDFHVFHRLDNTCSPNDLGRALKSLPARFVFQLLAAGASVPHFSAMICSAYKLVSLTS